MDGPGRDRTSREQGSGSPAGAKALARSAMVWAKRREPQALRAIYAARRAAFVGRLRLLAAWYGAQVDVDVAPDVRFGKAIAITVWPGSRNVVRIGPGCRIDDRVLFILKDGNLLFGDRVEIRRDTTLQLWGGTFELAGENILSWGNVVHCGTSIRVARMTSFAEYVTLVDSSHYFTEPDEFFYHNTTTEPIEIGYNTFVASKVTIGRGSKVGDHCVIASHSVVTGEVPSGHLASGAPAQVIREVPLPWKKTAAEMPAAGQETAKRPRRRRSPSPEGQTSP